MVRRVGIREAKAKLSHYVELARQGEDVVLTDRGLPVIHLVPIPPRNPTEEDVIEGLAGLGLLDRAETKPSAPRPVRPRARASISTMVREMRR